MRKYVSCASTYRVYGGIDIPNIEIDQVEVMRSEFS